MSHGRHRNRPGKRQNLREDDTECEPDWREVRDGVLGDLANGYFDPAPKSNEELQMGAIRNLMDKLAAETDRADAAETILKHRTPRWLFWLRMIGWTLLVLGWGYLARVLAE